MKHFKRIIRMCGLILFLLLALCGIGIFGVAPTLTKDNKLFADIEWVMEAKEEGNPKSEVESLKLKV